MKKAAKKKGAKKKGAKKKGAKKKGAKKKTTKKTARKRTAKKKTASRKGKSARRSPRKRPKPARKSALRKKGKKKPHTKKPRKNTVTLSEPNGPDGNPILRVSHKDKVRWYNATAEDRTLTFGIPIFTVPDTQIMVPAYGHSNWYTISPTTPFPRSYSYGIDPAFDITGIPDPPYVSADP
jgi:hypothetical protein